MGGHEKVGDVFGGDIAGDCLVAAGGVGVFQNGLVVDRVNPDCFEESFAEVGVGCAKVCEMNVGFGGGSDTCEIKERSLERRRATMVPWSRGETESMS